jgi:hypothetical protein
MKLRDLTNNQQHFTESCPELGLAIPLYGEDIDQAGNVSNILLACLKDTHA